MRGLVVAPTGARHAWRRSSGAEQAAHNRCVGGSSPPAATEFSPFVGTSCPCSNRASVTSAGDFTAWRLNPRVLDTDNPDMSLRHCRQCGTDVEDVGGYCLLGHPLRLAAPTDSLATLRAEVNQAFADVEVKVAEVLAVGANGQAVSSAQEPAPGSATAETSPAATAPPPPPPPRSRVAQFEPSVGPDPITEFAPAPKMDWGPERGGLLRRFG